MDIEKQNTPPRIVFLGGGLGGTIAAYEIKAALRGRSGAGNSVPEPSTWVMLLLGFGAIGYRMRRRRMARTSAV